MSFIKGIVEYRRCATCREIKHIRHFNKAASHLQNVIRTRCIECETNQGKSRWQTISPYKRKESNRKSKLKKRYNIQLEVYLAQLKEQGGMCAICRGSKPGGRGSFNIDHEHVMEYRRGLLCYGCNVGLGAFGEDPKALRAAADYLEFYRGINE